jgi:hypothetical protein
MSNVSKSHATSCLLFPVCPWLDAHFAYLTQHFKGSIMLATFDSFKLEYKDYSGINLSYYCIKSSAEQFV